MNSPQDHLSLTALPFVGRTEEIERLVRFWRATPSAAELRGALLVGEAGVGKSRLVNEVMSRVAAEGGVVVRARLVPESGSAIVPLLAQGLWYAESARPLLKGAPEENLPSVIGALRRLARLRPTLLIVEDLHLVAGDALRELAALLDTLFEESLSLLATTRPVELPARAVIERVLVQTVVLRGLDRDDVAELWTRLFGDDVDSTIIDELAALSSGNPLALGAALRGLARAGALLRDREASAWRVAADHDGISRALRRSVSLLAGGMAAHLTPEERAAAEALATLGEVIATESAAMLLDDPLALAALLRAGVIVPVDAGLPALIAGRPSADPLTFSHTLLHQHLLERASAATIATEPLAAIVAGDAPLYSVVPFRLLAAADRLDHLSLDTLRRGIERVVALSLRYDAGTDWRLAGEMLAVGWRFLAELESRGGVDDLLRERLILLNRDLAWRRRDLRGAPFEERLELMLALTERDLPADLLPYRLGALYHLHLRLSEVDRARCAEVWERVAGELARHPELEREEVYLYYLDEAVRVARLDGDEEVLRRVERRMEDLLAADLPTERVSAVRRRLASGFLLLFDSERELERRLSLLKELPEEFAADTSSVPMNRISFLETIGRMEECLAAARTAVEGFQEIGQARNAAHCALIALCCRAALGMEPEAIIAEMNRLVAGPGYASSPGFARNVAIYLTEILLLRDDPVSMRRVLESLHQGELYWIEGSILLALEEGRLPDLLDDLELAWEDPPLRLLASAIVHDVDREEAAGAACDLLGRPLLRVEDLLRLHAALALLAALPAVLSDAEVATAAAVALATAIDWTLGRRLLPIVSALLRRHGRLLPTKELDRAEARRRKLERRREASVGRAKLRVRMIGTIAIIPADGEPAPAPMPVRGLRLKALLALLVAARMVKEPMTHREFCRLAADGEPDPDLARKTANMGVSRLRDLIGDACVVTGKETYELNLDLVEVDLLEASSLIDAARDALRARALLRAVPALMAALDIAGGDVPFPGLYGELFEALREDFDYRLRATTIDVVTALLRESDAVGAETLLRRAMAELPGDEELAELLRSIYAARGMRAEAAVMELKAAGAV